ncbi:Uncharacterised protein [Mycobacterium tuberculosis]|nr:Uncharacterised protein [Mycobacterium tuberculosis]
MHDRISAVCRVPSESTAKLGTPRLSSATVRSSNGSICGAARWCTMISASARSSASDATAARRCFSSRPSITSTGSAHGARKSAPGSQARANGFATGTHTLAVPVFASCRCSSAV